MQRFTRFQKNTSFGSKTRKKKEFSNFFFRKTGNGVDLTKKQKKVEKDVFLLHLERCFDPKKVHREITTCPKILQKC